MISLPATLRQESYHLNEISNLEHKENIYGTFIKEPRKAITHQALKRNSKGIKASECYQISAPPLQLTGDRI